MSERTSVEAAPDIEEARRSDLALLASVHEQVLREAGRTDVAGLLVLLQSDPLMAEPLVDGLDIAGAEHLARALTVHLHLVNLADGGTAPGSAQGVGAEAEVDAGDVLWPAVSAAGDQVLAASTA